MLAAAPVRAEVDEQAGWAMWFSTARFTPHWGHTSDIQVRTDGAWDDVQTLIFRPGLTYFIDGQRNLTAGYAWQGTMDNAGDNLVEHRFWQQYVQNGSLGRSAMAYRIRLEQRFVELPSRDREYSQRIRFFARSVIPLPGVPLPFRQGPFVALQNEVFLTLQQGSYTSGRLLEQNRAYAAAGWRLTPGMDLELGYLNQYVPGRTRDRERHVLQLALYTRF
jgi:hypothetical protein